MKYFFQSIFRFINSLFRQLIKVSIEAFFLISISNYHWRRQWHPTPVLLPGKSHGWRSLEGCSPWGRWGSDTTEQLHFHFSLSCIGEGNGNPLQCSCLENPRDRGAWWAAVYGVAQSRTRLKWCSRRKIKDMFIQWYMNMKMFIVDLFICGKGSNCPSMGRVNKFWYTHTVNITQQSKGMNCWICTGVDAFSSSFCFDNISPFSVSAL